MNSYIQSTGLLLRPDGTVLTVAYSGIGLGLNNPRFEKVKDVGPLPCGIYRMGDPVDDPKLGNYAIPLTPDVANEMFGRSAFFIHGDEIAHPGERLASDGCIVASLSARKELVASGDRGLEVIAEERAISA